MVQYRYSRLTTWTWLISCHLVVMDNSRLQTTLGDELLEWDECTPYATQIYGWVPTAHMCSQRPFVQTQCSKFILFLNRSWMNKELLKLDLWKCMDLTSIHPSIYPQLAACWALCRELHVNSHEPLVHPWLPPLNECTFLASFYFSFLRDLSPPCSVDPV